MGARLERLLTIVLVASGVVIAASLVHREFPSTPSARTSTRMTTTTASYMPDWRQALAIGVAVGDTLAPVKIVELGDLESPAGRSFPAAVRSVLRKHAADVSLIFVHFPPRQHRFALVAARAAECANDRGKFAQTVDVIYG